MYTNKNNTRDMLQKWNHLYSDIRTDFNWFFFQDYLN